MTVGNGTYESIPDTENGGPTTSRGSSSHKWFIGSAVLIAVVGAVYGATTYIHNKDKTTSSADFMDAIAGTTKMDSNGKLKLFDSMSTSQKILP
jgi:hypothetical protein